MGWFILFLIAVFVLAIVLIIVMMNKRTDRALKQAQEQAQARLVEPERMQVVHNNNSTIIYRDAQTGVQYLRRNS